MPSPVPPPPSIHDLDLPPELNDIRRPWWGLGDVLLSVPVVIAFSIVGAILGGIVSSLSGDGGIDLEDAGETSLAFLALAGLGQQAGQTVWPWVVSKWKGRGMALDWRWTFKPIDIAIGLGVAVAAQIAAGLVGVGVSILVGLEDNSTAENTQFLTDSKGSLWIIAIIFMVCVGAPISEELLFRGLIHRAFEKRGGPILAIIGSTFLFGIIHLNGEPITSDGQIVLWASIGTVGLILGITAQYVGRLGPCVIAHVIFNTFSTMVVLFT